MRKENIMKHRINAVILHYSEFKDHRQDQAVYSLLAQKYNVYQSDMDLTQFSNTDPYLIHHRNPV